MTTIMNIVNIMITNTAITAIMNTAIITTINTVNIIATDIDIVRHMIRIVIDADTEAIQNTITRNCLTMATITISRVAQNTLDITKTVKIV
jgi:hypothetical protein